MSEQLPTRLESEPLVEVIAEVRFDSLDASAVNLLPGILSQQFPQFDQVISLPISQLPLQLVGGQDGLKYLPHIHLVHGNDIIAIGPHVLSVAQTPPYSGWTKFAEHAIQVFSQLKGKKFLSRMERLSLRYADLLEFDGNPSLDWLNAKVIVGKRQTQDAVQLRVEHGDDDIRVVTSINGPATTSDGRRGMLVDVDTIKPSVDPVSFWDDLEAQFDRLHAINKSHFFSLLTKSTLTQLKPVYE